MSGHFHRFVLITGICFKIRESAVNLLWFGCSFAFICLSDERNDILHLQHIKVPSFPLDWTLLSGKKKSTKYWVAKSAE